MFLVPNILNKLMKEAYKRELTAAMSEDNWLYLAGRYWEVSIKKEFIPNRTLGDVIALTGELPKPGERFAASKAGNQIEVGLPTKIDTKPFEGMLNVTNVLLIGVCDTLQRVLQDEVTGDIYVVNNVFIDIVSNAVAELSDGEEVVREPFFHPKQGILWRNNVCMLQAGFRYDDENEKVLENLKGVDITTELEV